MDNSLYKSSDRCDLHLLLENEVNQTKFKINKIEEKQESSYESLNSSIIALTVQMKTYMAQQEYRDKDSQEVKIMTLNNANDINELKSSIKSVQDHNKNVVDAISRMDKSIGDLSEDIREMDKTVLGKKDVVDIAKTAITEEKNLVRNELMTSLPAKISAGVAVLSFITFYAMKVVLMILSM